MPKLSHDKQVIATYFRDYTLEVAKGEFLGIIGPNGAGKTTLLTVINGLGRLVHGRAWVLGSRLHGRNGSALRKRIGYVAQVQNIDARLPINVRETVMVGCYGRLGLFRRPTSAQRERVENVLEMVGIAHLSQRPIGHLSGGEYQKTAIARALVQQPEIFLLDEPTASIDPQAQGEIMNLIQLIHREYHMTTLLVTHDLKLLPAACDRLVLMKEGKIWRQGNTESMLEGGTLDELYEVPAAASAETSSLCS